MFDKNKDLSGTYVNNIPVYDVNELESYLKENNIDIVVFAIPAVGVKSVIDTVINSNIKGIWNFSYLDLNVPPHIAMVNMHLSDSLMTLAYKISEIKEKKGC
jgi:redox-sensing transcriptional repressor